MNLELSDLPVTARADAVELLAGATGLSRSRIKQAMTRGAVWLESGGNTRRLRRAKTALKPGDRISIYYASSILETEPPTPDLLHDGRDFSVWIKPAGAMSGGSRFGDHCAMDRLVEKALDRPARLVHRLDRFVWGVMAVAHSRQCAAWLSRQFQERRAEKCYQAIVHGELREPLRVEAAVDGREAISRIMPIEARDDWSLVSIEIDTGRKHQIRRHLAGIGHPVAGDRLYGGEEHPAFPGLQLASVELSVIPPGAEAPRTFELPADRRPTLTGPGARS